MATDAELIQCRQAIATRERQLAVLAQMLDERVMAPGSTKTYAELKQLSAHRSVGVDPYVPPSPFKVAPSSLFRAWRFDSGAFGRSQFGAWVPLTEWASPLEITKQIFAYAETVPHLPGQDPWGPLIRFEEFGRGFGSDTGYLSQWLAEFNKSRQPAPLPAQVSGKRVGQLRAPISAFVLPATLSSNANVWVAPSYRWEVQAALLWQQGYPFWYVIRYPKSPSAPLTTAEFCEWLDALPGSTFYVQALGHDVTVSADTQISVRAWDESATYVTWQTAGHQWQVRQALGC